MMPKAKVVKEIRNKNHHLVCKVKKLDNEMNVVEIQKGNIVTTLIFDQNGNFTHYDRIAKAS